MTKPYNGVPHKYVPSYGGPLFFYKRGGLLENRHGTWEIGIKRCDDDGCRCKGKSCLGLRRPHIFLACPHCGTINAEHREKRYIGMDMSISCFKCERHLWITLKDWKDRFWDEILKGEKSCGASPRS